MDTGRVTRAAGSGNALPPCPITGKPALRRIHGVSARLIEDIWRRGHGIDVSRLFRDIDRLTLFESPTGLVFFEPRIIGDAAFYDDFYRNWDVHTALTTRTKSGRITKRQPSIFRRAPRSSISGAGPVFSGSTFRTRTIPASTPMRRLKSMMSSFERHWKCMPKSARASMMWRRPIMSSSMLPIRAAMPN